MLSSLYRRTSIIGSRLSLRRNNLCTETLAPSFSDNNVANQNYADSKKAASSQSFATLLRNSPFIQLGNPVGKVKTKKEIKIKIQITYLCVLSFLLRLS